MKLTNEQIGLLIDLVENHIEYLNTTEEWKTREQLGIFTEFFQEEQGNTIIGILQSMEPVVSWMDRLKNLYPDIDVELTIVDECPGNFFDNCKKFICYGRSCTQCWKEIDWKSDSTSTTEEGSDAEDSN